MQDTTSVQALLDSLRASTAWQKVATGGSEPQDRPGPQVEPSPVGSSTSSTAVSYPQSHDSSSSTPPITGPPVSVAALLSQLQASSTSSSFASSGYTPPGASSETIQSPFDTLSQLAPERYAPTAQPPSYPQSAAPTLDLRYCTFQQALPHLARLSENQKLVETVRTLKQEQAQLERRLWDERLAIQKKHEEKVRVARTKANMIGAGLTQYEADTMTDGFRRELQKFDAERALPAWDGLIAKQQTTLESLAVPTMFVTTVAADRERQQRVMQVVDNFAE